MELGLNGALVFVAAASKGLGLGAAMQFAAEGANVTIASRSADNLARARETILDETDCDGDAVFTVEMDLADHNAIESGIAAVTKEFGGLDALITNHGGPNNVSFEETSLEAFDEGYNDVLRSTVIQCKRHFPRSATAAARSHTLSPLLRRSRRRMALSEMCFI